MISKALEQTSTGLTVAGGTVTAFLGWNVDEWGIAAAVTALLFTVASFATNWYYKHKASKKR
jgi:hypothetical protein